jgi:hypothetical protein
MQLKFNQEVGMKPYNEIHELKPADFKRMTGISKKNFEFILQRVNEFLRNEKLDQPMKKRGIQSRISVEDKILLTLFYLRHYPTFSVLSGTFKICESYAQKIYQRFSGIIIKVLKLPDRRRLLDPDLDLIIVDVSEQPVERPVKGQRDYYSGKKKQHTIKTQLIVHLYTLQILALCCQKGHMHDFKIFKEKQPLIHPDIWIMTDLGYQGIVKLHPKSILPYKRTQNKPLTPEQKKYNRYSASLRIRIEHVNRRCKIFRAAKEIYRGKHKNYSKNWAIVAALVNLRYAA